MTCKAERWKHHKQVGYIWRTERNLYTAHNLKTEHFRGTGDKGTAIFWLYPLINYFILYYTLRLSRFFIGKKVSFQREKLCLWAINIGSRPMNIYSRAVNISSRCINIKICSYPFSYNYVFQEWWWVKIYSLSKEGGNKIYLSPCPLVPFVRRKGESKETSNR